MLWITRISQVLLIFVSFVLHVLKKNVETSGECNCKTLGWFHSYGRFYEIAGGYWDENATFLIDLCLMETMVFLSFLAVIRGVTTKQLYPEYDLELSD